MGLEGMPPPHPLPPEQLKRLSLQRLLQVLKIARCAHTNLLSFEGWYASEEEWNREKAEVDAYEANIKALLVAHGRYVRPQRPRRALKQKE